MASLSSYSAAAIRTTAAMFTIGSTSAIVFAPTVAEAAVDTHYDQFKQNWVAQEIIQSPPTAAALVVTDRHNEALYDALRASQTLVSGPILIG